MDRTALGYEIRAVGLQPGSGSGDRRHQQGQHHHRGPVHQRLHRGFGWRYSVLGVDRRLINGFSNDYGFSGISVAALAADSPVALFAGIVFGALVVAGTPWSSTGTPAFRWSSSTSSRPQEPFWWPPCCW